MSRELTVNARSSHLECSRIPSSLVNAQLQLLPWLNYELIHWELDIQLLEHTTAHGAKHAGTCRSYCRHTLYWILKTDDTSELETLVMSKLIEETCYTHGRQEDTSKKLCNTRTFINTSFKCNAPVSSFTFTCTVLTGFLD